MSDFPDYQMFEDVPAQTQPPILMANVSDKERKFLDTSQTEVDWTDADTRRERKLNDPRVKRIIATFQQKLNERYISDSIKHDLWLEFLKGAGL